jgi:predicted nucleic acid-binding protein
VTDASPLIGLAIVNGLAWLPALFGTVVMPAEVEREVLPGKTARGETGIADAVAAGWLCRWAPEALDVELPELDEGETACIRIALAHKNTPDNDARLLMDEGAGRAVAQGRGLHVAGTAAVIGQAQARELIPSARRVFEVLHQSDFRISAVVIRAVLARVG